MIRKLPPSSVITNGAQSHRFSEGVVPDEMKIARVKPLLKSPKLDPNELKNFRSVSTLSYISILLERVVARRLNNHMITNDYMSVYNRPTKLGIPLRLLNVMSTMRSSQIWIISQLLYLFCWTRVQHLTPLIIQFYLIEWRI